ncbi:MAG: DUF4838 domain-containing protein, partial [Armatimonadetes bacterium]|nr:DUF4838 domain-containing protein [Armatimonadota bacterium]
IKTVGPHLVIAGGRLRGTMYGVYTFLEDVLGCRWYSSKVSFIPKRSSITLKPLDITRKPDFDYRDLWYSDSWDADWAARNKLNGNSPRLDEIRGGKITYAGYFSHSFCLLVPNDPYLMEHPEYFSLVDGERKAGKYDGQLCLTNPDVLKVVTAGVLRWLDENPGAGLVSVTQNDNSNYCRCEKCAAIDAEEGSPSGLLLRFINAVADEVAKSHPNVLVDTFAYQYTEKPPKITKPRPNVLIRLSSIECCQQHRYEYCSRDMEFLRNLRAWDKITEHLYIWHYSTVFPHYLMPFPDLNELTADIPMYKRHGVKGIFVEGNYSPGGGGWMDELKAYLCAKLMWNTKTNAWAAQNDFLNGYFGKAGKPIGEWIAMLHHEVLAEDIHGRIFQRADAPFLTPEIMAEGERLFDEAERVADDPEVLERVKHARLGIEYVKVRREVTKAEESGTPADKAAALRKLEALVQECKADGMTALREWATIDQTFERIARPLRN